MVDDEPDRESDLRFPKSSRLLSSPDFDRVYARRCSVSDGLLLLHGEKNDLGRPRLGLTVSRRVGNAVVRNRWKRLLRETFRQTQHELPPFDMVVAPRRGDPPTLETLKNALPRLARRVQRKLEQAAKP